MDDRERIDKFTERARTALSLALEEAKRFNHNYFGTEHLLLGLVREGEGIAAGVLESLGVNLEKVRAQTIQVLNQGGSDSSVRGENRPMHGIPALSVERLTHIQEEMQQTFRIGDRDPAESLEAAQERAYSLARSMSELLAEIARLQEEIRTLRERGR
jgi:ATP-dependent Clp protease ATP-binding subunit ClpA